MQITELVVARFKEDLSWLLNVPDDIRVTVYDKCNAYAPTGRTAKQCLCMHLGQHKMLLKKAVMPPSANPSAAVVLAASMFSESICIDSAEEAFVPLDNGGTELILFLMLKREDGSKRKIAIKRLLNVGRESDTYLHHIVSNYENGLADVTIFCQGDPFDHSPNFLDLLSKEARAKYAAPVQPLSDRWLVRNGIPPQITLDEMYDNRDPDTLQRVLTHPFSMYTLDTLRFFDKGAHTIREEYNRIFRCGNGTNLVKHFLSTFGLKRVPAADAYVAELCFGALFSVTKDELMSNPKCVYEKLRSFNAEHRIAPYVLERCWMTIFGYQNKKPE